MADLLKVPAIGPFLRWRHSRTALQIPVLVVSFVMILHGLLGPSLAPKNFATTLTWVHFRGALVLVLLCAGNFFCMACPFMLVRRVARRWFQPWLNWPRALRNKWLSIGLFVSVLFAYELFDLWSSPWWTAWLIVAYFAGALAIDLLFKHAAFCKFVCPIGQFNFVASLVSPLEVAVRDTAVCDSCGTKDCIKGRRDPVNNLVVIQNGCELALFQPLKTGNMDCTFCLECVQACPHENVGILSRTPAAELMTDPPRSGIGRFSRRKDVAALVTVFTFGALMNAFGMVSPVYAFEAWLKGALQVQWEAPVLALIFAVFLILAPGLILGLAAGASRRAGTAPATAVRYSYALVPLGFGMWLAHYGFHFFTGLFTIVPLTQSLLGLDANWRLTGLPPSIVQPAEIGFLLLGVFGSLSLCKHLADQDSPEHPLRQFAPWAAVCVILCVSAVWLIFQPMEMRGMSQ